MRVESIELSTGKTFETPAFLPNPQTGDRAELIRSMVSQHSLETITGIVAYLEDADYVVNPLQVTQQQLPGQEEGRGMDELAFVLIPDFSSLFNVMTNREPEVLLSLNVVPPRLVERFQSANKETDDVQRHMKMMGMYPILSSPNYIEKVLRFQLNKGADLICPPVIPINSTVEFDSQVIGQDCIFSAAQSVIPLDDSPSKYDILNVVAIDPKVFRSLRQEREDRIVDLLTSYPADVIGVKLLDFSLEYKQENKTLLRVLNRVSDEFPGEVLLLNTQEFGLISFLYGVGGISCPIASSPYPRITEGRPPPEGNYYHKDELEEYSRDELMSRKSIRRNNYQFPCDCAVCSEKFIFQPGTQDWNDIRQRHFVFIKESEVRQLRDSSKKLSEAVKDKFARSEKTEYLTYIDIS